MQINKKFNRKIEINIIITQKLPLIAFFYCSRQFANCRLMSDTTLQLQFSLIKARTYLKSKAVFNNALPTIQRPRRVFKDPNVFTATALSF